MAIKLKNFLYNPISKFINVLLLLISAVAILFVTIQVLSSNFRLNDISFYETHEFNQNYGRLTHNALEKELVFLSESDILTVEQSQEATNGAISRLRKIEDNLNGATSFKYVLINKYNDEILTNISDQDPVAVVKSLPTSVYYEYGDKYYPEASHLGDYYDYSSYRLTILELLNRVNQNPEEDWVYYTGLDVAIDSSDTFFYEDQSSFETFSANREIYLTILIAGIILGIITMLMFLFTTGMRRVGEPSFTSFYDVIPIEFQVVIASLFSMPLIAYASSRNGSPTSDDLMVLIGLSCFIVLGVLLFLASLVRVIKAKKFFSKLLIVIWIRWFGRLLKKLFMLIKPPSLDDGYKWKLLMWIGIWMLANLFALFIMVNVWPLGLILLVVINTYCIRWVLKVADGLRILKNTVHNRTLGSVSDELQPELLQPLLRDFGKDIESLQDGLEIAIEDRLKGEKMKTELITNVTHDLKNPLTSIISYIELLKGKDAMDEESDKYIAVLDHKAQRLKKLIEQLVDAAKASSGTIDVKIVSLDLVQMIRQLCGEYEEALEERRLQCILPELNQKVMIKADPMILYRILDNIMSNVCKYAMEGTRVYLELDQKDGKVMMSVKNISSEPLSKNVEDLSRRFVRGDSSRNTEGSGLGISIALSLAKLLGATMNFDTDGDLFKVMLQLTSDEA